MRSKINLRVARADPRLSKSIKIIESSPLLRRQERAVSMIDSTTMMTTVRKKSMRAPVEALAASMKRP
jgi:hypothetical protein